MGQTISRIHGFMDSWGLNKTQWIFNQTNCSDVHGIRYIQTGFGIYHDLLQLMAFSLFLNHGMEMDGICPVIIRETEFFTFSKGPKLRTYGHHWPMLPIKFPEFRTWICPILHSFFMTFHVSLRILHHVLGCPLLIQYYQRHVQHLVYKLSVLAGPIDISYPLVI